MRFKLLVIMLFATISIGLPVLHGGQACRQDIDFGKMPLLFIENRGQLDEDVLFNVQGSDKTLYFTSKVSRL